MEISTLIITKAGGLTTAEALSKRLPILILKPLPGQEETNSSYFLEEGAAVKIIKKKAIYELIQGIISNPAQLHRMQEAAHRLSKPNASLDIAKFILELCSTTSFTT